MTKVGMKVKEVAHQILNAIDNDTYIFRDGIKEELEINDVLLYEAITYLIDQRQARDVVLAGRVFSIPAIYMHVLIPHDDKDISEHVRHINDHPECVKKFKKANRIKYVRIVNVIYNPPATIAFWNDGTKTVVKCSKNDEFDYEKGLAMAICKKTAANESKYYEVFKRFVPKSEPKKEDSPGGYLYSRMEIKLILEALICYKEAVSHEWSTIDYIVEHINIGRLISQFKKIYSASMEHGDPLPICYVELMYPKLDLEIIDKALSYYQRSQK